MNSQIVGDQPSSAQAPLRLRVGLGPIAERSQFCTYTTAPRAGHPEKLDKVPHVAGGARLNGSYADAALPRRLMTLDAAFEQVERLGHVGVGLVFTPGCGLIGLDLDGVLDGAKVSLSVAQKRALKALKDRSFLERSISGRGLHAIAQGDAKTVAAPGSVELFGHRGFLALTGDGGGRVQEACPSEIAEIVAVIEELKGNELAGSRRIESLRASKSALSAGLPVQEPIPVEVALSALQAIPCPRERDRWLRILMAAKGAGISQDDAYTWDQTGPDPTPQALFDGQWNSIDPDGAIGVGTLLKAAKDSGWQDPRLISQRGDQAEARESFNLNESIVPWRTTDACPPSRDFAIGEGAQGLFPLGKPAVLAGLGGVGKSTLALSLGLTIAAGQDWAGKRVAAGCAAYFSLEDDGDECKRRAIGIALSQFDAAARPLLERRVMLVAMPGQDTRLTDKFFGAPQRAPLVDQLIAVCLKHAAACDVPLRLIVIDHARLALSGDVSDSEFVTELMRALNHIGEQTGAAVLLLCHSPKSVLNPEHVAGTAADVLGSGAFSDMARFAAAATPLSDKERKAFGLDPESARQYLALRTIKSNYSESGGVIHLRKTTVVGWGVAVPVPVSLTAPPFPASLSESDVDQRVFDFIAARPGQISARRLREDYSGKDGPMKASQRQVVAAIDSLMQQGRLIEHAPTDDERKLHGLPHQTKGVLHAV